MSTSHVIDKALPDGNIYWRDIPKSACVTEVRAGWAVRLTSGRRGTAYWMGQENREAQEWLRKRAIKDAKSNPHYG